LSFTPRFGVVFGFLEKSLKPFQTVSFS